MTRTPILLTTVTMVVMTVGLSCTVAANGPQGLTLDRSVYPLSSYKGLRGSMRLSKPDFQGNERIGEVTRRRLDDHDDRLSREIMQGPDVPTLNQMCYELAFERQIPDVRCEATTIIGRDIGRNRYVLRNLSVDADTLVTDARLFFFAVPQRISVRVAGVRRRSQGDDETELRPFCTVVGLTNWLNTYKQEVANGGRIIVEAVCSGKPCPPNLFLATVQANDPCHSVPLSSQ